jgi:hypothetical protein
VLLGIAQHARDVPDLGRAVLQVRGLACWASALSMLMRARSYFKTNCPNAYAYAYDESSESALFTCASSKKANYQVTFCP